MTESLQNKTDINEDALNKLFKVSCIFRTILKKDGLKIGYKAWQKRIKSDMEAIIHNMLVEQEIANFNAIHKAECESLEVSGIHAFEVLSMELDFLGTRMLKPRHGLSDEYKKQ